MRSPDNPEAVNRSETQGGKLSTSSPGTSRALGGAALRGTPAPSTQRALGRTALGGSGMKTPEALERAANELEGVARKLLQVAQSTQAYQAKVNPIAQGVEQVVGGSATGMDRQIASLLNAFARDVGRSAAASHQAAQIAKRLAAEARAEAQDLRRQQETERQTGQPGARR